MEINAAINTRLTMEEISLISAAMHIYKNSIAGQGSDNMKHEADKLVSRLGRELYSFPTKDFPVEDLARREFDKGIADDGLFPNHTDKDIWIVGFKAGYGVNRIEEHKEPSG